MKKALLILALGSAGLQAAAQCVPNPLYADSVFGVWPDTTENFVPGVVGVFYSDTLNLIVPVSAHDIDPVYPEIVSIDSVHFTGATGLPPGLSVNCNSQTSASCTYLPTMLGCGLLEGTPTTAGVYPITLDVLGWINFFGPQSVPLSFDGYEIVITENTTGVLEASVAGLGAVHNVPNPFAGRTSIEFTLPRGGDAKVRVFNLLGEEIWNHNVTGKAGVNKVVFESGDLQDGVYLYKVQSGKDTFTGRMVLHR